MHTHTQTKKKKKDIHFTKLKNAASHERGTDFSRPGVAIIQHRSHAA